MGGNDLVVWELEAGARLLPPPTHSPPHLRLSDLPLGIGVRGAVVLNLDWVYHPRNLPSNALSVVWGGTWESVYIFEGMLGLNLWHMEVHRPGVESELQLPANTTATATPESNLHCSSWQPDL